MTNPAEVPHVEPASRRAWRDWLERHHGSASGVWLVSRRATADGSTVTYEEAVEEALCFGWVDGQAGKVDEQRTKLYFAPRRARSGWAGTNKARVERLLAAGQMHAAGMAAVERAKTDGSWTILDGAERGEVPDDLAEALEARPPARARWDAFPPSVRRGVLAWIAVARRPETRAKRIGETATRAERNERPSPWQRPARQG
jgi:uncharacterized protein YdeI (YjbR/CyaY-like superfamily)